MEPELPLTSADKSPLHRPQIGHLHPRPGGSGPRLLGWHPCATHECGAALGVFRATDPRRWRCCWGIAGRVRSCPAREQRSCLSSPPGPVVYLQPELFTSATGPSLHHGHRHAGPRHRLHPRAPQVPLGLCWGRRRRALSHGPILLHTPRPSCPATATGSSSPPRRIRPREMPGSFSRLHPSLKSVPGESPAARVTF